MMKKFTAALLAALLAVSAFTGCAQEAASSEAVSSGLPEPAVGTCFAIAGMKGPTTMGMVKLMADDEAGETRVDYDVQMFGAADEIVPLLVKGELDMAAVPANLASVLYAKTEGAIQVAAVNTLGVLYVVETGDSVTSIEDLKGKTVYSTGKGTTPEYVLNHVLRANGIDPAADLTIEYKSEATEVAAAMQAAGEGAIALLPQPYVTSLSAQLEGVRVALDLTEEWNKVSQTQLITGVLVVRKDVLAEKEAEFKLFLEDYAASTAWVNENVQAAAELVAGYGIIPKAPLAQKAIPACNITYMDGDEMQAAVSGYLSVLHEQDPAAVGGSLPGEDFYYHAS